MTSEQVVQVCQRYSAILTNLGAVPFRDRSPETREGQLNHLRFMCDQTIVEAQTATSPPEIEKAMRWLGFIQGAFFSLGIRTIDEMREDNR